jgi:hypothetical protein
MENNHHNELELPLAFSGPAQLLLYTRYGDPRENGFEQKWIALWEIKDQFPWFPKTSIRLHKHFKPLLEEALKEILVMNLQGEIKTVHDDFSVRMISGSTDVMSVHSWGVALDMNAEINPLGAAGKWSEAFLAVMRRHHIYCGQDWEGLKDPMHFSMING